MSMLDARSEGTMVDAILEAVLSNTTDAFWVIDSSMHLLYYNRLFAHYCRELLGHDPVRGEGPEQIITHRARLRSYWRELYLRTFANRSVITEGAFPVLGIKRYFSISGTPVIRDGVVTAAVFSLRDITEYRRRESHEYFKLVLARIFSEEKELARILERVLEAFCLSIGWDVGVFWVRKSGEETLSAAAVWYRSTIAGSKYAAEVQQMEFGLGHGLPGRVWESRAPLWYSDLTEETVTARTRHAVELGLRAAVLFPIEDSSEQVVGVCEFLTFAARPLDSEVVEGLTEVGTEIGHYLERHRSESERVVLQSIIERKSREWTTTFDTIDSPVFVLDGTGKILRVNRAAREYAGTDDYKDIVGHDVAKMEPEHRWKIVRELVESARDASSSSTMQFQDVLTRRYWDVSVDIAPAERAEDHQIIVFMRDITRLVELQDSVRRGEQLSAMGELVAGVAHEVRNPLFGISATLDAIEMTYPPMDEDSGTLFVALRKWVARLSALMEQLLEYGKAWSVNLHPGELNEIIQAAIDATDHLASNAMVSVKTRNAVSGKILLDPARLVQVFQNLIMNAIQHSKSGDSVEINVDHDPDDPHLIRCSVRDFGPGFDRAEVGKVFQPFYTKRRGGTGLGLSIVQRVVDEHGGTISAENHPDGGAIMTLTFPKLHSQRVS